MIGHPPPVKRKNKHDEGIRKDRGNIFLAVFEVVYYFVCCVHQTHPVKRVWQGAL